MGSTTDRQALSPPGGGDDRARVLIVEDDRAIRRLIATVLSGAGHSYEEAADAAQASERLQAQHFDVVVCDIQMPGESGLELVPRIRDRHPHLAILMVTASDDPATAASALDAGADGYLTKPFRSNDVLIGIINVLRHRELERQHIPERRQYEADALTGLPDRRMALAALAEALERAEPAGSDVAVLLVNVDRFALVNAALGHEAGDALLLAFVPLLRECARPDAVIARLAADEFAIICADAGAGASARALGDRVLAAVRAPLAVGDLRLTVTASIGIAIAEGGVGRADALTRDAGIALRRAKSAGGNVACVFELGMREAWMQRLSAETELRRALEEEQFRLFYQPIVDLHDGGLAGLEALLRWQHPEHGIVPPGRFIPIAEETGLIVELGAWVIAETCRQLDEWRAALSGAAIPQVSVNVSARQFAEPGFLDSVATTLRRSGVGPDQLAFEITEGLLIGGGSPLDALNSAHDLGIRLVLDDFGTGYSSLGYLKRFPVQALKIDRMFITEITDDGANLALVRAIVAMAASLEIAVTAEGVETQRELGTLRSLDCHFAQGYLFARPMPAPAATKLLREERTWLDVVTAAMPSGRAAAPRAGGGRWTARLPTAPAPGVMAAERSRLLKPADAAAALGVSLSTVRRWADTGRLPLVKTQGGHRRFRVEDIRRLKEDTRGDAPAVQAIPPPTQALPGLAGVLSRRADELLGVTTRHLYPAPVSGWFGGEDARPALARWLRDLARAARQGDYDRALAASRALMERAQIHGAMLLERHRFLDSFGELTVRLLAQEGSSREELTATRRLFSSLSQSLLGS